MAWQPSYCTLAEFKGYAGHNSASTADDARYNLAITAASRAIDQSCNRQFGLSTATAREYTPYYDRRRGRWVIETDDFPSSASLTIAVDDDDDLVFDVTISSTAVRKLPLNAADDSRPYEKLVVLPSSTSTPVCAEGSVRITTTWGWSAVPDTIKEACLLQALRFFTREKSPYGVAGSPQIGSELRLLNKVDPDVDLMLLPYRRMWGAV